MGNIDEMEANKLQADRTQAMKDQKKMRKIEKSSKAPAVKDAAKKMEQKEEDEQLNDLQDLQEKRKKEDADRVAKRKVQAGAGEDAKKLDKAVQKIRDKMMEQKAAAKKIMDFEGNKYKNAVRGEKGDEVAQAKLELKLVKDEEKAKTTSSDTKFTALQDAAKKNKDEQAVLVTQIQKNKAIANEVEGTQHETAENLRGQLAEGMERIIAAQVPTKSEAEQKVAGELEVAQVESATQAKNVEAVELQLKQLEVQLSTAQNKRVQNEKEIQNILRMMKSVAKKPIPELPKGIKAPAEIEEAKEAELAKKQKDLIKANTELKDNEVRIALAIEKAKKQLDEMEAGSKQLIKKTEELQRTKKQVQENETNRKYSAEAVAAKVKKEQTSQKAKATMQGIEDAVIAAKRKQEDAKIEADRLAASKENDQVDSPKIENAKKQVLDINTKLKNLSEKISQTTLDSVEAGKTP